MKRNDLIRLTSAVLLIIAGNVISGFLSIPFIPMIITLVVVPVAVYLVASTGIHIFTRGVLAVVPLILNDLILKIFFLDPAPNMGEGIIILLLAEIPALFISSIVLLVCSRRDFNIHKKITTGSFLIFCLASVFYLYLTGYKQIHPLGRYDFKTMALAEKKGILISELTIDNPLIVIRKDTILLKNAWLEKDLTVEPRRIISKIKETGRYRVVVRFDYQIEDWGYSNKYTFYPDGDKKRGGFLYPKGIFTFVTDSLANAYLVTFVRLKKDSVSILLCRKPGQN